MTDCMYFSMSWLRVPRKETPMTLEPQASWCPISEAATWNLSRSRPRSGLITPRFSLRDLQAGMSSQILATPMKTLPDFKA
jgi:hypothetical protein